MSWTDLYCGGGGSSSGLKKVPGQQVWTALNHCDVAIETHNLNHPEVDHDKVDITLADPHKYRSSRFAWISPECTTWSGANGEECDYDDKPTQLSIDGDDPNEPVTSDVKQRSRVQMEDVVRFARVHQYLGIIVENVTDILKWRHLPRWKQEMAKEDYLCKVVVLNSAFARKLGDGAPQLRDRVYFMFWKKNYPEPNWAKWLRPRALCPTCGDDIDAIQEIKPGKPRKMYYNRQYFYRCPKTLCRGGKVYPYALPALAAIDLTLPSTRIGDRPVPLVPNTYNRIDAGLKRHLRPDGMLAPASDTWENGEPLTMPTRAMSAQDALVVPLEGRPGLRVRHAATEPMRAQTTRHQDALVVPLRNNGIARLASQHPLMTVAASGEHHALVMRNYTARGDQGQMSTRVNEPMRTLTASGGQSLIQWDHAVYSYDTGLLRPLGLPLPAQTTVQGDALLRAGINVEDCLFRMLEIDEVRAGMAFPDGYMLLGNRKEKVMMLGNAVTPPAARDLAACLVEAITGNDIELVAA